MLLTIHFYIRRVWKSSFLDYSSQNPPTNIAIVSCSPKKEGSFPSSRSLVLNPELLRSFGLQLPEAFTTSCADWGFWELQFESIRVTKVKNHWSIVALLILYSHTHTHCFWWGKMKICHCYYKKQCIICLSLYLACPSFLLSLCTAYMWSY